MIIFNSKVNLSHLLYNSKLHFDCEVIYITEFIVIYTLFDVEVIYLYILYFEVLINVSKRNDFSSLFLEYNSDISIISILYA